LQSALLMSRYSIRDSCIQKYTCHLSQQGQPSLIAPITL